MGIADDDGGGFKGVMFPTANTLLNASLGSEGRVVADSDPVTSTGTIFLRP